MYSERVRRLISELPNSGSLERTTHSAQRDNPICDDATRLELRVEAGRVRECRFKTRGCPGAIASAAAIAEMCPGRTVEECLALTVEDLLANLQGLPRHKRHGAILALETLHAALQHPAVTQTG